MQKSISEQIIEANDISKVYVVGGKVRRTKTREKIIFFSRDELINFLFKNKIKTIKQLNKIRIPNKDPHLWHYRREFGRWSESIIATYGEIFKKPPCDAKYIIDLIIQFDAYEVKKYLALHKKYPKIFPAFRRLIKVFGKFSMATFAAKQHSVTKMAEEFLNLKRRLGRIPKIEDCKNENIDLVRLKRMFGSKKRMEKYLLKLEKISLK